MYKTSSHFGKLVTKLSRTLFYNLLNFRPTYTRFPIGILNESGLSMACASPLTHGYLI